MIKLNELRIGNWVTFAPSGNRRHNIKSRNCIVLTIEKERVIVKDLGVELSLWSAKPEYIGVPLTPEILDKAGFVLREKDYMTIALPQNDDIIEQFLVYTNGVFLIDERVCDASRDVVSIPFKIKFLHQLQNLYSALSGEELTIAL